MKFFANGVPVSVRHYSHEEFLERLALESSIKTNVIAFFQDALPSLTQKLKGYVSSLKFEEQHPNIQSIEKDYADLEHAHLEKRFLLHRDILVQVPEGFKGEFLPYVHALDAMGAKLYEQTHQLLTEYRFVLSSILTNQEQRTSLKDLTASYEKVAAARSKLEHGIAPFFEDSAVSRARLISVLPSFREGRELVRATKRLNQYTDVKQLRTLQQSVKEVVEVIDVLEAQVAKSDMTEISPEIVKNIGLGAYELAQHIDKVVVFHYAVLSIIGCVEQLMKKMKELQ